LALLAALPSPARADWPVNFYIRFGVITDKTASFNPLLWSAGLNFDFYLSDFLFIAAETDMIVYKFEFSPLWRTPAVTLNLKLSDFYVGAGVSKFIIIGSGSTLQSDWLFKADAGFKGNSYKLQFFVYSPFDNLFKDYGLGFTLGLGF
jgi:hypothetical protein